MKHVMRVDTEELRGAARHMRQLMGELDYVGQRVGALWGRLDSGWSYFSSGAAEAMYADTQREMSSMAAVLHQCAWSLEATVNMLEEADHLAAHSFDALVDRS